MKKTLFITLLAVIAILACACGGSSSRNEVLDKTPEEIINHIYATAEKTEVLENINEYAAIQEITPEMSYWFLGTEGIPFEVGTASEPLMSPANYSFCIVKIKEGEDFAQVEQTIKDSIDPRKWVCMSADVAYVERIDEVIAVILAEQATADSLKAAFLALGE